MGDFQDGKLMLASNKKETYKTYISIKHMPVDA